MTRPEPTALHEMAVQPDVGQAILIGAMAVLALVSLVYALRESRRRGDWMLLFVFVGSGLSVFYEPLGDQLVHVYYPERNQITWIHNYGLDIPVFIGLLYFWYMPLAAYVMLRKRQSGFSAAVFWSEWIAKAVFFIAFEIVALAIFGTTWIYFGEQAFVVAKVPVLTPVTYASFALAIGLLVCLYDRFLPRRLQWTLVLSVPVVMATSHIVASAPLSSVLWSTDDPLAVALGSIGCAVVSIAFAWLVSIAVRMPWFTDTTCTGVGAPEPQVSGR